MDEIIKPIAIIPMRGGSKRLKNKNILPLGDLPLGAWIIKTCMQSNLFQKIIISTDDKKIKDSMINAINKIVITKFGLEYLSEKKHLEYVHIQDRPKELAEDSTQLEDVIEYVINTNNNLEFDYFYTFQCTSPFTTVNNLFVSNNSFVLNKYDSMLSCFRLKKFIWRKAYEQENSNPYGISISYNPTNRPRMQDYYGEFVENGAFYITKKSMFQKYGCRIAGKIGIFEMDSEGCHIDIDNEDDYLLARKMVGDF